MARVLGIDYGQTRVGFAVSDAEGIVATPLTVKTCASIKQVVREVVTLVAEEAVERIVVGHPVNMNGTTGPIAEEVETFRDKLVKATDVPVELWDERLTTRSAERVLIDAGTRRKKRKLVIDKLAAQIMLQSYLDSKLDGGGEGAGEYWSNGMMEDPTT